MGDSSASAERHKPRWFVPRWILTGWFWLNVPLSAVTIYGWGRDLEEPYWRALAGFAYEVFGWFPMSAYYIPAAFLADDFAVWIVLALVAVGCHVLILRRLPKRLAPWLFFALVVAWIALTVVTLIGSLWFYSSYDLPGVVARRG